MEGSRNRVVIRLPKRLQDDLNAQIGADGYGMMGKSRWVSEAISMLLDSEGWIDKISYEVNVAKDCKEDIKIDNKVFIKLNASSEVVKEILPNISSPRSSIVRHAIMVRINNL